MRRNNHLLSKHFASIVLLRIMLSGVYCLIVIIGGFIIGYSWVMMEMLLPLILNQLLISFILYLRSNLAGLHLFKTDSIISVLDRTIMIAICGFLLWRHTFDDPAGIRYFVYAQTLAYAITLVITFIIVIDKAKVKRLAWRWPFFLMILKKSYPFAILVLLTELFTIALTLVMLERMLDNGAEQIRSLRFGIPPTPRCHQYDRLSFRRNLLLPIFARMIKFAPIGRANGAAFFLIAHRSGYHHC